MSSSRLRLKRSLRFNKNHSITNIIYDKEIIPHFSLLLSSLLRGKKYIYIHVVYINSTAIVIVGFLKIFMVQMFVQR